MNEGIHLDLDTWIVPGQIRKANLCRRLGNRYTPAGTEVLISAVAHNTPPPFQKIEDNIQLFILGAYSTAVLLPCYPHSGNITPGPCMEWIQELPNCLQYRNTNKNTFTSDGTPKWALPGLCPGSQVSRSVNSSE